MRTLAWFHRRPPVGAGAVRHAPPYGEAVGARGRGAVAWGALIACELRG
ncbi:hypothetical protein [Sinosporangium siamense]|nr:hypothetical protein [Sinosporangium siamense]